MTGQMDVAPPLYEQPCPHCGTSSGWFVRGTRAISFCYGPEGDLDEIVGFPEMDKVGQRAYCRREGCGKQLRPLTDASPTDDAGEP